MQGGQDTCCSTGRRGVRRCGVRVVSGLRGQRLCAHICSAALQGRGALLLQAGEGSIFCCWDLGGCGPYITFRYPGSLSLNLNLLSLTPDLAMVSAHPLEGHLLSASLRG